MTLNLKILDTWNVGEAEDYVLICCNPETGQLYWVEPYYEADAVVITQNHDVSKVDSQE